MSIDWQIQWLQDIKGLNDTVAPGQQKQVGLGISSAAQETADLLNSKVRFGNVYGRNGLYNYGQAAASSTSPIIGLLNYKRAPAGTNNQLLRLTPSKLELFNGISTWSDKTGVALNGLSTSRPDYTIQNDILIYTMEGQSRPQGYGTNSAVAVNYTTGTTLGGTPPFAKCVTSYMQFVLLGNISADGSYTDLVDGWRTIEYSGDPFFTWTNCNGNTIDLYQTPGGLLRMLPLGRVCMCYKTDGVIALTWVGTAVKFTQELVPGSVGIAGPRTLGDLGNFGHAYLGTNGIIYHVQQGRIDAVSHEKLSSTLPPALSLQRFRYARAMVLPTQDLYVIFYDRTGLSGQFLDSYVTWNYRTGEFGKGELGQQVIDAQMFKPVDDGSEVGLVSGNTKVWEYDSDNNHQDDDGVRINRYWTTGWQKFGGEEGWFMGVSLIMRKSSRGRVKIAVARNFSLNYEFEDNFTLKAIDPDPLTERVQVDFRLASPIRGQWFNVKVAFYHDDNNAVTELYRVGFMGKPTQKVPLSIDRIPNATDQRGS
jgi:hypothetical protein